jgi:hypothetical protein
MATQVQSTKRKNQETQEPSEQAAKRKKHADPTTLPTALQSQHDRDAEMEGDGENEEEYKEEDDDEDYDEYA